MSDTPDDADAGLERDACDYLRSLNCHCIAEEQGDYDCEDEDITTMIAFAERRVAEERERVDKLIVEALNNPWRRNNTSGATLRTLRDNVRTPPPTGVRTMPRGSK